MSRYRASVIVVTAICSIAMTGCKMFPAYRNASLNAELYSKSKVAELHWQRYVNYERGVLGGMADDMIARLADMYGPVSVGAPADQAAAHEARARRFMQEWNTINFPREGLEAILGPPSEVQAKSNELTLIYRFETASGGSMWTFQIEPNGFVSGFRWEPLADSSQSDR